MSLERPRAGQFTLFRIGPRLNGSDIGGRSGEKVEVERRGPLVEVREGRKRLRVRS